MRRESLEYTLERLAAKGRAEGCAVLDVIYPEPGLILGRVGGSGRGDSYYVVGIARTTKDGRPWHDPECHGCDCAGYRGYGYCKHVALLMELCGLLPDVPDADHERHLAAAAARAEWRAAAARRAAERELAAAAEAARLREETGAPLATGAPDDGQWAEAERRIWDGMAERWPNDPERAARAAANAIRKLRARRLERAAEAAIKERETAAAGAA